MSRILAPRATLHGVFIDILGMGVLLTGDSGLGKSGGLELISRGHGLVADDAVDFVRLGPDFVEGRCRRCCRTCSKCAVWACSTSRRSSAKPPCGK